MTSLLTANGDPVDLATTATIDTFDRPDGYLVSPDTGLASGPMAWQDAADYYPDSFDRVEIKDGQFCADTYGLQSTYGVDSPFEVTHRCAAAPVGRDDNVELEMVWPTEQWGYAAQMSLCFGVDWDAPLYEMGILYVYDISLYGGSGYWHNIPRTPTVASVFDPTYYEHLADGALMSQPQPGRNWWRIRVVDGWMQAFFGNTVTGVLAREVPVERPEWSLGRDLWGIHCVGINLMEGETRPDLSIQTTPLPLMRIASWSWRPYDVPLV